jgi:esterase/lipase superfamily enzyme
MNREYHRWHSPALDRDMELLVFGHAGARVLAFPTSMGRFYQWEDFGMVEALAEHLERGWIQLYCVDSVDGESWYARGAPPEQRARRNSQYDRYLEAEVLPFSRARNPEPYLISAGASFGAYHAVNFAFRHPQLVDRAIGLSGLYDVTRFAGGSADGEVYFHNPSAYIANEHDPDRLAALRHVDTILAIGRDDPSYPNNEEFSALLWRQDIWHALRIWDGWAHDWPFWRQMIVRYIGGHD